jgi:hypothetical protein
MATAVAQDVAVQTLAETISAASSPSLWLSGRSVKLASDPSL